MRPVPRSTGFSGNDSPANAGSPHADGTDAASQTTAGNQAVPGEDAAAHQAHQRGQPQPRDGNGGTQGTDGRRNNEGLGSSFLLSNINRLITKSGRSKSSFLRDQAELSNAILVAVTETWLNPTIFDSEVSHDFPGYSLRRCDRARREGGGVALYLRDDLTGDLLLSYDNDVCQLLVVHIHQLDHVVAVIYRPPDTRCAEFSAALTKLDIILSSLPTPIPTVTILGDLNLPRSAVKWVRGEDGNLLPIISNHREGETADGKQDRLQAQRLADFALKHSLTQQVDKVTHGVEILDLIFTSDHELVGSVEVESWKNFTDHKVVTASVNYQMDTPETSHEETHLLEVGRRYGKLDFNKSPWTEIQAELEAVEDADWDHMGELAKVCPTAALAWFHEKVLGILERLVPEKKKRNGKLRPRMCRQRRILWRRLAKIKARIKTATSIHKLTKLLQERWELEQQLRDDYTATNNQEEDKAVFNIKTNSKVFFSFARSRQKTKAKVGPFVDPETGKPNPSPDFAAEILRKQYDSVFNPPRPAWVVQDTATHFTTTGSTTALEDIVFTTLDIERACAELKASSAGGADGVPASLLKNCRKQLSNALFQLWRGSLDLGKIPEDLLLVLICPVHKGGDRSIPKNYRPVALTSHITKVFERVVRHALVRHLEENNLLPSGQHGFRSFRSTLTQLLAHWDSILEDLQGGGGVDCIYLDFRKHLTKWKLVFCCIN